MRPTGVKADRIGNSALLADGEARLHREINRVFDEVGSELGSRVGLADADSTLGRLKVFIREIELWNPKLGLVEALGADLLVRHFFDCLALIPELAKYIAGIMDTNKSPRLADIGSGAGFPGLVIAACFPQLSCALVEKQARRCGFLLNAKTLMGLRNVEVFEKNLEDVPPSNFHLLTARAFKPLEPVILASLKRILVPGGAMLLLKGRLEKINEELALVGFKEKQEPKVSPLVVSDLAEERHLVVLLND